MIKDGDYKDFDEPAEVENLLKTIRQYRAYYSPELPNWKEYVDEFFHVLGFSTIDKNPHLMTLRVMGSDLHPCAVVGFVRPGDDFEELLPWLTWESYIQFAANFYRTDWGIFTDGLKLKIFHFQGQTSDLVKFWPEFDHIILQQFFNSFYSIYEIVTSIKGMQVEKSFPSEKDDKTQSPIDEDRLTYYFLVELHAKALTKTQLHAKSTVGKKRYFGISAGKKGMAYGYNVLMDQGRVDLYINNKDKDSNKEEFQALYQHKTEIEELFGGPLEWQLMANRKASRIRYTVTKYGVQDTDHWNEFQDLLIDAMIRLEMAFRPFLTKQKTNQF